MRRLLGLTLVLGLAACLQTRERTAAPTDRSNTDSRSQAEAMEEFARRYGSCDISRLGAFLGATPDADTVDQLLALSGAVVVRIIKPGEPVSLEGNSGRLNVELDREDMMSRFFCG